ncbi:unnamed protein product [Enterobius vermicularis]|uniref:ULP_PROTEASE domain-containing protein n=1 Tax=Enterobius vermicularis TaxID=51028 RepID=A0A0N4VAE9_ENTVE|nr:unnamed protein product [Enterobius vermicularis]
MCPDETKSLPEENDLRKDIFKNGEELFEEGIEKLVISECVSGTAQAGIREKEFPELDKKALEVIRRVWGDGKPNDEKFGGRITRKDLLTLYDSNWLNDEVINTYLELICERAKQDSSLPKVYAFTTFFYANLSRHGYTRVKRWTKKVDIFLYDILLVPLYLRGHWCLTVIDLEKKLIHYYSQSGVMNTRCLDLLRLYLNEESIDKKKEPFDTKNWKCECRQVRNL